MPIDFNKLRDPSYQAQVRKEREEAQALVDARNNKLRAAVNVCQEAGSMLTEKEQSLARSCHTRLSTYAEVSESQEKWLLDIAKRVRSDLPAKAASLVAQHAGGNPDGEHPEYPRSRWPYAQDAAVEPVDYWAWVIRVTELYS